MGEEAATQQVRSPLLWERKTLSLNRRANSLQNIFLKRYPIFTFLCSTLSFCAAFGICWDAAVNGRLPPNLCPASQSRKVCNGDTIYWPHLYLRLPILRLPRKLQLPKQPARAGPAGSGARAAVAAGRHMMGGDGFVDETPATRGRLDG